uniref:Fungal lipase-like domain-containing protein n=1 Tax=Plectus sambesii TaxID=2011161 RepID=A0A914UQS5_9BILA
MAQSDICPQQKNCTACTSQTDGFFTCRWCIATNACYPHVLINSACANVGDVVSTPFNCPVEPFSRAPYSDVTARNSLFLSAAAYSPTPAACLQQHMPTMVVYNQYDVLCDDRNNSCWAYTAVSTSDRRVVISFRGTRGFEQLALEIFHGAEGTFGKMVDFAAGGKVIDYFSYAFYAMWNSGLQRDLADLNQRYNDYQLWIVGHSLGGALASMTSALVVTKGLWNFATVHLMTFGQPRVGDISYAQIVEENVAYRYRVVHEHDIVPHIPPEIPDGVVDSPIHHRFEVWYDNDMSYGSPFILCFQPEDLHCSSAHLDLSVFDHLSYFGTSVGDYGRDNCTGPFDFGFPT